MSLLYLDCNATTPIDSQVVDIINYYNSVEYGNAGSRTHEMGAVAKAATELARNQIASVLACERDEVIFTSGATESNNIAILGLKKYALSAGKRHIISTKIEHKAVLEPLSELEGEGFNVTYLPVTEYGRISIDDLLNAYTSDTLLVSVMHANNETGVIQPINEICDFLSDKETYFHVDAAQTFGKVVEPLRNPRIDLISMSSHKIYGPKGVGALSMRRRSMKRPPLSPLIFGGGQEKGLRPGTLPVSIIAGFGLASEIALKEHSSRMTANLSIKNKILNIFNGFDTHINGDQGNCLPNVLNISLDGIDSEAVMVALKDIACISNGSACTSTSYTPSHVLSAMGLDDQRIESALRLSWCHLTELGNFENEFRKKINLLL